MRQWFESLPSRDQIALMALVAALGLWLFVQLIFIELDGRRDRLTQSNQALAEKLIRVDLKVEQLAALRAGDLALSMGAYAVKLTATGPVARDDGFRRAVSMLATPTAEGFDVVFQGQL